MQEQKPQQSEIALLMARTANPSGVGEVPSSPVEGKPGVIVEMQLSCRSSSVIRIIVVPFVACGNESRANI
ncbi:hypothetical protein JTE90_022508 [Oedothorax gibbosus]|uniref:Uncharacterized protein n=1 Tax=Oedothorax gibbosus TaxID=931172 RepID=A0AAV6V1P0_9ARAC|nr:hypothetical protein JTE90_022508 [Oedothorax gibbosus]